MAEEMIVRSAVVKRFADTTAREVGVILNKEELGSDQLLLVSRGINFQNYIANNPTVFWGHDADKVPIAKTTEIRNVGTEVHATVKFDAPGQNALGDEVYSAIKFGSVNAVSIGFQPLESEPLRGVPYGRRVTKSRLMEVSFVGLPALESAIITARKLSMREGKTLSAANEAALRGAHQDIVAGHEMIATGADKLRAVCDAAAGSDMQDQPEDAAATARRADAEGRRARVRRDNLLYRAREAQDAVTVLLGQERHRDEISLLTEDERRARAAERRTAYQEWRP